jgi:hypothetical protein
LEGIERLDFSIIQLYKAAVRERDFLHLCRKHTPYLEKAGLNRSWSRPEVNHDIL